MLRRSVCVLLLVGACRCTPPPAPSPPPLPSGPLSSNASDVIDSSRLITYPPLPREAASPDDNPTSAAKVDLGHRLFFAPLSTDGQTSCESCHVLASYGVDGLKIEKASAGTLPARNTPTVYNAALNGTFAWDARATKLDDFVKMHLFEKTGLNASDTALADTIRKQGLEPRFREAFPSGDPLSAEHVAQALSAYLRKLVTPSAWDRYLRGDKDALTAAQRRGFNVFVSTGCATCHAGINVGGSLVQKRGVVKPWPAPDGPDKGRYNLTNQDPDIGYYRSAPLRNLAKTAPYLHDGLLDRVDQVVPMMAEFQLGKTLSVGEVSDIVAFLGALTGDLPPVELISPPGGATPATAPTPAPAPKTAPK